MNQPKILVTGANGQIGQVLTQALRNAYGTDQVLATDITEPEVHAGPFEFLDIMNKARLEEFIEDYEINQIYHLAAILSANGERNPKVTWNVNFNGMLNLLSLAQRMEVDKVFFPSTIAVFGETTPKLNTPQDSPLLPETVYGISKVTGELWANYYWKRFGMDIRSVRFPGIIGHQSMPSGGTTDYAVEIYHKAVLGEPFECFLKEDTRLPMMYMDDAIKATIQLMESDATKLSIRSSYNIASMSFTPGEITKAIRKHYPNFEIIYKPDFRQAIAESWNESIDDSPARKDWDWKPAFDLDKMTTDMIHHLKIHYNNI